MLTRHTVDKKDCGWQVPGEMFKLAMAAKRRGMGIVGSTQNILDFIADRLSTALKQPYPDKYAAFPATSGFQLRLRLLVGA